MLLEKLCEYSGRMESDAAVEVPPPMYQKSRISWIIDLDEDGSFVRIVRTSEAEGREVKRKGRDRGAEYLAPHLQKTFGVRAKLLADTAEYVLGVPKKADKAKRAKECQEDFIRRVRECAQATGEPAVRTALAFLESIRDIEADKIKGRLSLSEDFDPGDVITFRVSGVMPIDLPNVRSFWAQNAVEMEKEKEEKMQCIVCGERKAVERRIQFKIKGIPDGQPSGMAIISANVNAFESYGLEASLIAPTCRECSECFSNAANSLLSDSSTSIRVGPVAYIFWTRNKMDFFLSNFLSDPDPGEVRALIESVWKGREAATELGVNEFYAASFSASGSRVAVRDWLDTTVDKVKRNLARYFVLQEIVDSSGEERHPLKLYALAMATVRESRDLNSNVPCALVRAALKGAQLPGWLLYKVVQRIRAEGKITRSHAALIKMVLLSDPKYTGKEGSYMTKLELQSKSPAYLCGRLFAVLEEIQRAAIPGAGATITDRYFGTASSAPASIFGKLLRESQHHLGKLRKEKGSVYHALERRLEEVLAELHELPKTLSLQEQGLFSLGYYHQRAYDRAQAVSKKGKKEVEADSASEV